MSEDGKWDGPTELCWCFDRTVPHAVGEECSERSHWLEVEDSEMPESVDDPEDAEELSIFSVAVMAIHQRLERLEKAAGIEGQVPADIELDRMLAEDDDQEERP